MATPKETYAQQFRAYAQPAATPVVVPTDIPASVRTYSVFDPNSNTWRRMTNGGRSPLPVQGQTPVVVQTPVRISRQARTTRTQPSPKKANIQQKQPSAPSQSDTVVLQKTAQETAPALPGVLPSDADPALPAEVNEEGFGISPDGTIIIPPTYKGRRTVEGMYKHATGNFLPDLRDAVLATKFGSNPTEIELGQSVPIIEHAPVLDGTIAPYSFGGNAPKADPALTAKTLGAMGALIGTGGAAALGIGPLALLGTVGRGALSTGGRMLGGAGTLGGRVINPALQRGKGLIDWAKSKITRTKPNPDWQTPL